MKKCFQVSEKKHAELNKLKAELMISTNDELVTFLINTTNNYIEKGGLDFVKDATAKVEEYLKHIKDVHPHLAPILIRNMSKMVSKYEP